MSLFPTILTAYWERHKLLLLPFCLFISNHVLAGIASSFATLMSAQMLIACAHAVFWSIIIPLAVRVSPLHRRSRALALMVTGSSLATVLGVPIGTVIGNQTGWRITFSVSVPLH